MSSEACSSGAALPLPDVDVTERRLRAGSYKLKDNFVPFKDVALEDARSYAYFKQSGYLYPKKEDLERAISERKNSRGKADPVRIQFSCLVRGVVSFPVEKRDTVYDLLADDAASGAKMFWSQIGHESEGFRFAVDIDTDERFMSADEIYGFAKTLHDTLRAYYTNFESSPIPVFVAHCGPRLKNSKLCTRLHFICHVRVTVEEAQQLTYGFECRLKASKRFDLRGLELDTSIYKPKSRQLTMRMVYSSKLEGCPACRDGESRQSCGICERFGRVLSTSTYEPCMVLDARGERSREYFSEMNGSWRRIIRNYSIWSADGEAREDFVRPPTDPIAECLAGPAGAKKSSRRGGNAGAAGEEKTLSAYDNLGVRNLVSFIRSLEWRGERLWAGSEVGSVSVRSQKKLEAFIQLNGLNASFCPYENRDHGNNRLFFVLTRNRVTNVTELVLRCRSNKYEACKRGDSVRYTVPSHISSAIFGLEDPLVRIINGVGAARSGLLSASSASQPQPAAASVLSASLPAVSAKRAEAPEPEASDATGTASARVGGPAVRFRRTEQHKRDQQSLERMQSFYNLRK